MSPERFVSERSGTWSELEAALRSAGGRPERLGGGGVRRLGELYRATVADLAYARRAYPAHPLVARLEALVLRARATVYGRVSRRGSIWHFFSRGYWRRLAERPAFVFASWALLLLPAVLGALWAVVDAPAAAGMIPGDFANAADPPESGRDFDAATSGAFSVAVMTNNIQVTLFAFVGGITFGLVTVWALVFNGLILGVIGGLAVDAGNGVAFLRLISSHGPLEISCIVVGGIAGLRLGWSLVAPGTLRRSTSLRLAAVPAVELAVGTVPWLVLCGFLEGFATGPELPVWFQAGLGVTLLVVFWSLVVWRGREQ